MNDDLQSDLLKHVATISTGAAVVVVALRSELASAAVSFSLILFFSSLSISMSTLAWKAIYYGMLGEDATTYQEVGLPTIIAYLFFIVGVLMLVGSLVWTVI